MITERGMSSPPTPELAQNLKPDPNRQSLNPPLHVASSTQPQATEMRNRIELQQQQEMFRLHRQQELDNFQRSSEIGIGEHNAHGRVQESMLRETESQISQSRNGTSPIPGADVTKTLLSRSANFPGNLKNNEMIQQFLKQQVQQHTHNQHYELQLRQQEQQLHHQRHHQQQHHQQQQQQQQHHPPQSALHQILSRHHQREQSQHQVSQHSHEDARRRIEQHSQQQTISNIFPSWPPTSQLLQLHQLQQSPMLALGQSNHSSPLSSLMGLAPSGSGLSPGLLAQLESLNTANRNPTQADQQASDLSALINAQSLLGYANGAGSGGGNLRGGGVNGNSLFHHNTSGTGNSTRVDDTHSPHNLPQHSGLSDAMALLHAMQRDNGSSQHGFGGPDRQG